VILPDLTEETRKEFIKKAKAESENAKVSIRNVRRDGNNQLKDFLKEKEISQDEERQGEEQIQKLTDLFVEKVDTALEAKEKDLLDF
jgi:ribosome recycling factor